LVSLLFRFYDIDSGEIKLDGHDIKLLNINWLRSKIGLVSQEPILFNTSILENICYGQINKEKFDMNTIIDATIKSNIHFKIENLPQVNFLNTVNSYFSFNI
jgi:ABC-type multidrug transport system fused ATPase/permease subunit